MQIAHISDTHGRHRKLKNLPSADMLVHSGDLSMVGEDHEVEDFIRWFSSLNYEYKIFIAGNHDFWLEGESVRRIQRMLPPNTYYLCDSGVTINGINIWGSPISPTFYNLAFNCDRGPAIRGHWKMIPADINILITHAPPYGILDVIGRGIHAGCEDLLKAVEKIKPTYHLFGHIHEAYGRTSNGCTTFVNGSTLNERYELANEAITFNTL